MSNTICDTCANGPNECSWMRDGIPVEGWEAKPTRYLSSTCRKYKYYMDSFEILTCPKYVAEKRSERKG